MAVDKNKALDNAAKYIQKGQIDKAIKEFTALLNSDPKNVPIRLKRADLYSRQDQKREALEDFIKAGEDYTKGGFYSKAVAVFKQALQVDNRQLILYLRLGELYHKLGLASEALQQYRTVASYYDREGKIKECLDILRKMVELDPENLASRVKLGELYYRQGMKAESQEEFSKVAQILKDDKRIDDLITLYERVLVISPMNLEVVKDLGQIYVSKGEPQKALAKLQVPLKEGTRDIDLLELLGRIYYSMKREDKAKTALKEIARICREDGDDVRAQSYYKKVLQLDPNDQDARQFVGVSAAPKKAESVIELSETVERPSRAVPPPRKAAPKPEVKAVKAAAKPAETAVSKFFTEAEVYLKYGLKEKAVEQILKITQKEPKNQQALKKLVELYSSTKEKARASGPLMTLADVSMEKGSKEQAEKYLAEALGFDPSNKEVKTKLNALRGIEEEEEVEEIEEVQEVAQEEEGGAAEPQTFEIEGLSGVEESTAKAEEVEEEAFEIEEPKPPPKPKREEKPAARPAAKKHKIEDEEIQFDIGEEEEAPERPAPRKKQPPPEETFEEVAPEEPEEEKGGDVVEELDEAEFYIQQGLFDEAKKIYQGILRKNPGEPKVLAKLKELEGKEETPAAEERVERRPVAAERESPPSRAEAPEHLVAKPTPTLIEDTGEESHFDLAKELEEELGFDEGSAASAAPPPEAARQISVDEVLSAFKEGVNKTLGKEDGQAHYDLGIAYKEMGLIDEAIGEFQTTSTTSVREVDSLSMMGLCYMEKGDTAKAIGYYSQAVASPKASEKEKVGLHYELANAYEATGNLPEAMRYFAKVIEKDSAFRDALARANALKEKGVSVVAEVAATAAAPPPVPGAPAAPPASEAPAQAEPEASKVIPFTSGRKKVSYV